MDAGLWFYLWDRQELISAVGIAVIPRSKCEEPFFGEFIASVAQVVLLKHGHGSLDDVESPTGEPVLVGDECKEEVESELFRFEVFDPLLRSKSMVKPRKVAWDLPVAMRNDWHELFFKRHDWFSKLLMMCDVGDITCCMENRRAAFDGRRKPKKLESFQLAKPSDLCLLYLPIQSKESTRFTEIAQTKVDSKKKIQQINKFRWKEDSKIPSFTTLY